MGVSQYTSLGYASLHINRETRDRFNLARAELQARRGEVVTQDEFLNYLLNATQITQCEAKHEPQGH